MWPCMRYSELAMLQCSKVCIRYLSYLGVDLLRTPSDAPAHSVVDVRQVPVHVLRR